MEWILVRGIHYSATHKSPNEGTANCLLIHNFTCKSKYDILEANKFRCFVENEGNHYDNGLQTIGNWYDVQVKIRHNEHAIREVNRLR